LEEVDFNRDYGFTVLGISRHGQTIQERPMATPLQFGDSLLLLGHISKLPHLEHNPNLMLLGHQHFPMINRRHALITVLLLAGVIFTAITGVLNPAISIPLAAVAVVLFGCVRLADAYNAVDWQAVVTAAGMIPFGLALEKTGAAAEVAQWAGTTFQGWGPPAMLAVVLLLGMVLTHFVDNSAAAIMVAPVAYRVALELGVDPKPFLVGLAICISASFCTPFAHESTILVMGPGRYQFKHYLQIGSAMAFLTWLLATLVTPLVWKF
jgi:di/tricarboxylate transporter